MQCVMDALRQIRLVTVERNRRADITADDAPLLVVMDGAHTAQLTDFMDTAYEMQLAIDGAISAEQDADLGPNLNALYAATISSVRMGSVSASLPPRKASCPLASSRST
jgi:hypothetical protein